MSPLLSAQGAVRLQDTVLQTAAGWLGSSFPGGRQSLREKSSAATSLPVLVPEALGSFPRGLSFAY